MNLLDAIESLKEIMERKDLTSAQTEALVLAVTSLNDRRLLTCGWCAWCRADTQEDGGVSLEGGTCALTGQHRDLHHDVCLKYVRLGTLPDGDAEQEGALSDAGKEL